MLSLALHTILGALFDSLHDRDLGPEREGSTDDVRNLVGPNTEAIDAEGMTVRRASSSRGQSR